MNAGTYLSAKMPQTIVIIAFSILLPLGVFGLFILQLWLQARDEAKHSEVDRKSLLEDTEWSFFEAALNRPFPFRLRELYEDAKLMQARDICLHLRTGKWQIEFFNPVGTALDERNISNRFSLANDETGRRYQVDIDQEDSKVWLHDDSTGNEQIVADRLSEFVVELKKATAI